MIKSKKILIGGFSLLFAISTYGQQQVNSYKYVIVPEKFDFLKKGNDYQLSELTKFLFDKYGFETYLQGEELPEDLTKNRCKALKADVANNSGMFVTKFVVLLKDCNDTTVFTSTEGRSRVKEYKQAYHQALRDAFKAVKLLNYNYQPSKDEVISVEQETKPKEEVLPMIQEIQTKLTEPKETVNIPSNRLSYVFNEVEYLFDKKDFGYEIIEVSSSGNKMIGTIVKSSRPNSFVVKAGDLSGNGYFDSFGNFTLERVNPVTNKIITDIFARQ